MRTWTRLPHPLNFFDSDDEEPGKTLKPKRKRRVKAIPKEAHGQSITQPLPFSISFVVPAHFPDLPDIPLMRQAALKCASPLPANQESPARYHFPPIHLFGFQSKEKTYEHIHKWTPFKPFRESVALKQSVYLTEPGGLKIQVRTPGRLNQRPSSSGQCSPISFAGAFERSYALSK